MFSTGVWERSSLGAGCCRPLPYVDVIDVERVLGAIGDVVIVGVVGAVFLTMLAMLVVAYVRGDPDTRSSVHCDGRSGRAGPGSPFYRGY